MAEGSKEPAIPRSNRQMTPELGVSIRDYFLVGAIKAIPLTPNPSLGELTSACADAVTLADLLMAARDT